MKVIWGRPKCRDDLGAVMTNKRMRSGLVGAGFAATFHIEALRRVYGVEVEVVGVCKMDTTLVSPAEIRERGGLL